MSEQLVSVDEVDLAEELTPPEIGGRILLSERDYAQFAAALDNPKLPTPELQAAMAEYQRLKVAHPDSNLYQHLVAERLPFKKNPALPVPGLISV